MKSFLVTILFAMVLFINNTFASSNKRFKDTLSESIDTSNQPILQQNLNRTLQSFSIIDFKKGGDTTQQLIAFIAIKILLPIAVLVGVIFAFIGFYKIMTSSSEDEVKKGNQFLIRGTIGVMIMVSAGFITDKLVGVGGTQNLTYYENGTSGIFGTIGDKGGVVAGQEIAAKIYEALLFPIIKMLMFVIIGILFIIMFINLFKYLFSPAEDIEKKALTIIIRNVVGILTIVLSKYIIEAIFGKYDTVANQNRLNTSSGMIGIGGKEGANSHLGNIGTPLGDIVVDLDKFFTILNWILGLLTLIILILIIYQGYKLLTNPTDSGGLASVGKTLFYIFLGIMLLGLGYIVASAIIPVP